MMSAWATLFEIMPKEKLSSRLRQDGA